MGAKIDWTAAGGIDSVRQLTITHGPREAARLLKLSPAHSEALRKMCSRGRWLDAVRPRPAPALPPSMSQPVSAIVPVVPTASDAHREMLSEGARRTRAGLTKYAARMAEEAGEAGTLEQAQQLKAVADIHAKMHPEESGEGVIGLAFFQVVQQRAEDAPVIDV